MTIPLDAYAWTLERTQEEIAARLPKGWSFEIDQVEGNFWQVTLLNEAKESAWQEQDAAVNLALFNALAWLDLRITKPNTGSPWAPRRQDLDLRTVHEDAYRKMVSEDPPDLDPKEVESVYSRHPHKR